jgi:hypothetical protein
VTTTAHRIWAIRSADGYAGAVAADWDQYAALDYMNLNSKSLLLTWQPPGLKWAKSKKADKIPDASALYFPGVFCFRSSIAGALFRASTSGLELLPATMEDEDWMVLNCLRGTDAVDFSSSDLLTMDDAPGFPPRILDVRWINITEPTACELEIFCLCSSSLARLFCTDAFVDRVHSLGLRGLDFKHVGYIVADASQAVPKPPAPPPPQPRASKRKPPKLTSGPLSADEQIEIAAAGAEWRQGLQLSSDASAETILQRLTAEMQKLKPVFWTISAEERTDALLGLSAIYGELLQTACGWTWAELRESRTKRWVAMLAPSSTHALALVPYVQQQIQSESPTVTLLFNMIVAGQLVPAEPGRIALIG